jgi:hypothetical protein
LDRLSGRYNQGRQFYAYARLYGLIEKGDGNSHASDYFSYIDDLEWEDYIFICTKNNVAEIAELLTEIYFKETDYGFLTNSASCSINKEC